MWLYIFLAEQSWVIVCCPVNTLSHLKGKKTNHTALCVDMHVGYAYSSFTLSLFFIQENDVNAATPTAPTVSII